MSAGALCSLSDERPLAGIVSPLLSWYEVNRRALPWREDRDPYHIWISEIMLQQTRVEAVKPYYAAFLAAFPDIRSLADAPEERLMKCWEGLGYYSRARNLQAAAKRIVSVYGGKFPSRYEEIRSLPGIGPYTAGAVASIAFDEPEPAIDGNVLRVVARLTGYREDVKKPAFAKQLRGLLAAVYPAGQCGAFTQSLMELGATVCVPNGAPACSSCPLRECCAAHAFGEETRLPVLPQKKPRRIEARTVFLIRNGGKYLIMKRPPSGLLRGLWEFPNALGTLAENDAREWLLLQGLECENLQRGRDGKHVFSHIEWNMISYEVISDAAFCPASGMWVSPEELRSEIMLPTAFRQFLPESTD